MWGHVHKVKQQNKVLKGITEYERLNLSGGWENRLEKGLYGGINDAKDILINLYANPLTTVEASI